MSKYLTASSWWTPQDCHNHPECLYVYGDNDIHQGCRGQAIIRGQPNTVGIPTKKYPNNQPASFYTDQEYTTNIEKINRSLAEIIERAMFYEFVIFPKDGLGTGFAQLPQRAPLTYQYLTTQLFQLFGI